MSHFSASRNFLLLGFLFLVLNACRKDPANTGIDPVTYNPDWTQATHGNVTPDYSVVFPQDRVNVIEITVGSANWSKIRTNMISLYGSDFGSGAGMPPAPPGTVNSEPVYVDANLKFNGKNWKNIGFRLKGNSSLNSAWRSGNYKMPFRLNFDEFEDIYPGTKDQHFFGFEEMSFSPGFKDQSLIREKLAADIFRQAGIPTAQTAFYRVFVDLGAGLKYWGLYCGLEVPDDNMIKNQFGEESGNIYKPESQFTTFDPTKFEKKNNTATPDYTDVQQFVIRLNSPTRTTAPAQWRSDLEAVFNMDHFAKYLAINNAIVNWDTYGLMAHNYYLYNHSTRKICWIPWDNNESFSRSPGITGTTGGGGTPGGSSALSLTMNEVATTWPLIRYLAIDPVYFQTYKSHLKTFNNTVFTQANLDGLIDQYYNLITPFAIGVNGEQSGYTYLTSAASFTNERQNLKTHVANRRSLIQTFVP